MMFAWFAAAAVAATIRFEPVASEPMVARCGETATSGHYTYTLRIDEPDQLAALIGQAGGHAEQQRPRIQLDARRWLRTDGGSVWSSPLGGHVTVRDSRGRLFAEAIQGSPAVTTHLGARTVAHEHYIAHPLGAWARAARGEPVDWLELSVEVTSGAVVNCDAGDAAAGTAVRRVRLDY